MEPISFTAGLLSLGSLFSTCIECFDYFQAAKSFARGYGILLVKLDVEKTRLLAWGNGIGISDPINDLNPPQLGEKDQVARSCLENIRYLLQDAENLRSKYKLQETLVRGTDRSIETVSRYSRFRSMIKKKPSQPGPVNKVIWAISDSKKFDTLVSDLKGFVDSLKDILPPDRARDLRDQIRSDINLIPIENLSLVEGACADVHQDLSDVASVRIEASELGLTEKVDAWDDGSVNGGEAITKTSDAPTKDTERISIPEKWGWLRLFFVVTTSCLSGLSPGFSCDNLGLSYNEFDAKHSANNKHPENPASLISRGVDIDYLAEEKELKLFRAGTGEPQKVGKVNIWTAPCRFLVRTAFDFCASSGLSEHLEYKVRVDGRISPSCCSPRPFHLERLQSLTEASQQFERRGGMPGGSEPLDRLWVSRMVFKVEEENNAEDAVGGILYKYLNENGSDVHVVLGELDFCIQVMQEFDFVQEPRMPRVGDIWTVSREWIDGAYRWKRQFYGLYTISSAAEAVRQASENAKATSPSLKRSISQVKEGTSESNAKRRSATASLADEEVS